MSKCRGNPTGVNEVHEVALPLVGPEAELGHTRIVRGVDISACAGTMSVAVQPWHGQHAPDTHLNMCGP